ncbi:Myb/SANT-like DNA-binding domain-containing protein [Lentinula detonsa]|uniref:Myb/SANT-like DNA-binding domain-containing protein n=1 Tax=Lentinula detonsa TaxID=2804962 RepID=A0AA38UVW1_9AGAR|nr:Myb/SANT-like DNA-binding domain-containing protein [Lentinula detonsa]
MSDTISAPLSQPNTAVSQVPDTSEIPKVEQGRFQWDSDMDGIVIAELSSQKGAGFMASNGGFHTDAFTSCAAKLHEAGYTVNSKQCKTRYSTLKKDFKEVKDIREKSGFGWDEQRGIVTATVDVWDKLLQVC